MTVSDVLSGDVFDIRDVITRFEELEDTGDEPMEETDEEFDGLKKFLDEVKGNGGDHEWRGAWYPATFISDTHFEEYAKDLAEDIGAIGRECHWPVNHIDWTAAIEELQGDYSSVELDGETYWYR